MVADADFDGLAWWAVLAIPGFYERDVDCATCSTGARVKGTRGPEESDSVRSVVGVEGGFLQERLDLLV